MRVRIYSALDERIVEGVAFIVHDNAVEGLVLHESDRPEIAINIQARDGQVFTLSDGGFLRCSQSGHEHFDEEVVWSSVEAGDSQTRRLREEVGA